jgi:hypothetical protein
MILGMKITYEYFKYVKPGHKVSLRALQPLNYM